MKPIKLKMAGDEFYKTKFYTIIVGEEKVSFKQGEDIRTFKYDEVKKFYLKDSNTFVFIVGKNRPMYFRIAKPNTQYAKAA